MTTNREWLYSLDVADLADWFDAEHVDTHSKAQSKTEPKLSELFGILSDANDDSAPENDVSAKDVDANDGFMDLDSCTHGMRTFASETDSREKLEADMASILHSAYMYAWMHGHENRRGGSFSHIHREFFNMLDRQAAITERECRNIKCWDYCETCELQAKVSKLEAERNDLRETLSKIADSAHSIYTEVMSYGR